MKWTLRNNPGKCVLPRVLEVRWVKSLLEGRERRDAERDDSNVDGVHQIRSDSKWAVELDHGEAYDRRLEEEQFG